MDEAEIQAALQRAQTVCQDAGIPLDVPWSDLNREQQDIVINGDGKFWGVRGFFEHLERKKYKLHVRVFLSRYRGYSVCADVQRCCVCAVMPGK